MDNLPDIPYLTLSDKIHLAGLVGIFLSLLLTCLGGWLVRRDRTHIAKRIDLLARLALPPVFAAIVVALVTWR